MAGGALRAHFHPHDRDLTPRPALPTVRPSPPACPPCQQSEADLQAHLAKAEAALAETRAKSARLEAEKHALSAEATALRRFEPLLEEAESNVKLLVAEVGRVETELEAATRRARAREFATPAAHADAATETKADEPPAAAQQVHVPTPSNLATPLRETRAPVEGWTPSSTPAGPSSGDAHRRAISMGMAALRASPATRPRPDALHMSGSKRGDVPFTQRTPLGMRTAAATSDAGAAAPAAFKLGPALLRRP